MSWSDLVFEQNSNQHIIDVYKHSLVLTLESDNVYTAIHDDRTVKVEPKASLTAWPNPCHDVINILIDHAPREQIVMVYDMKGNLVEEYRGIRGYINLSTSAWGPGVYTLLAVSGERIILQKIIKA